MDRSVIPASEGRAHRVPKGARFRITTPKGAQAADFFAYNAETTSEWLSPMHLGIESQRQTTRGAVPDQSVSTTDVDVHRGRRWWCA